MVSLFLPPRFRNAKESNSSTVTSLYQQEGLAVDRHTPWCRISSDQALHAVLTVRAVDRDQIRIGSPVKISPSWDAARIVTSEVVAISEIRDDREDSFSPRAGFEVLCRMPSCDTGSFLSRIGSRCVGVFPLPKRNLADYLMQTLGDWIIE